jgi:hypothetical protein
VKSELYRADIGNVSFRSRSVKVPKRAELILSRVKGILIAIQSEYVVVFHRIMFITQTGRCFKAL